MDQTEEIQKKLRVLYKDKIKLHKAKLIIDWYCNVYDNSVLNIIDVDDVVRISFEVRKHCFDRWSHDAPYVKIIQKTPLIGVIQDISRKMTDMYPLEVFERIEFTPENIIEIPLEFQNEEKRIEFEKYLTNEKVPISGPLYTVEVNHSDSESDSESSVSDSSYFDSDKSNEDESDSDEDD